MKTLRQRLQNIDWNGTTDAIHTRGYALVPALLTREESNGLVRQYDDERLYRKTITMERYRFGQGEYKYFSYPLPEPIQTIRETVYPQLAPMANAWMSSLGSEPVFPDSLAEFQAHCRRAGQTKPTVLILRYGEGGHNTLHQDLYGDLFFPLQLVLFLSEPDTDYSGGEFVLVEQRPRAQSKAVVLRPRQGDMLLFTTNFRPVKGSRGYYRVNMKHGVSEVREGRRYTLGIIFHDAQ